LFSETSSRFNKVLLGLSALALALSGCASDPVPTKSGDNATLTATEVMFAQMMIPHHEQAVEMSELAKSRASDESVKALAAQIAEEQAPEIAQMQGWLAESGSTEHMGHEMAMDGMLSDSELETLASASGSEFDRLFLEGMIAHHVGAIEMAQSVLNSDNPEVRQLAAAIVSSQADQIATMKGLLN